MAIKHTHHIVPLHMGGTDDPSNLIELTIAKHAEAHRILFNQYGMWQDEIAWKGLAGIIGHEEAVRVAQSRGNKGKIVTEEQKRKQSEKMKGRKLSAEHKAKVIKTLKNGSGENNSMFGKFGKDNPHFGMKRSAETRAKISAAMKGNRNKVAA